MNKLEFAHKKIIIYRYSCEYFSLIKRKKNISYKNKFHVFTALKKRHPQNENCVTLNALIRPIEYIINTNKDRNKTEVCM